MSPKDFLASFHEIANAPGGVIRLRELILLLAGQGRLCQQVSSEEPASKLLERVAKARTQLLKKGYPNSDEARTQLRKQSAQRLPDGLPPLPSDWVWATLMQCSLLVVDCHNKTAPYTSRGVRLVRTTNVRNGKLNFLEPKFVSEETYEQWCTRAKPEPGDILFTREAPMGEVCIIPPSTKLCIGQRMILIRLVPDTVDSRFLLLSLMAPNLMDRVQDKPTGAIVKHLRVGGVETLLIPLPPLAEQKRIAAKVEELMALCDALETEQKERDRLFPILSRSVHARLTDFPCQPNLDSFFTGLGSIRPEDMKRTITNLALRGKLLQQEPADEPVSMLIARCDTERKKHGITTSPRNKEPETEEMPQIPKSWTWKTVEELLIDGPTNGISPKAVEYVTRTKSLTLSATTSGRFNPVHSKFIDWELPSDSELWLRPGDILVQRANSMEYVGVAALFDGQLNQFVYPDLMMRCRFSSALNLRFIHMAMNQDAARSFLRSRATGTSGSMPKINQTTLKSLPIPLPPITEQNRIVAKVDELMDLVNTLEAHQREKSSLAKAFAQACVASITGARPDSIATPMKTPKTQVVATLKVGSKKLKAGDNAPLTVLLRNQGGSLSAEDAWKRSGLSIDGFYLQLKNELLQGWIQKPEEAQVIEQSEES